MMCLSMMAFWGVVKFLFLDVVWLPVIAVICRSVCSYTYTYIYTYTYAYCLPGVSVPGDRRFWDDIGSPNRNAVASGFCMLGGN
jgi:hypothetical protein